MPCDGKLTGETLGRLSRRGDEIEVNEARETFLYYTDSPRVRYTSIDSQYVELTIPSALTMDLVTDPPQSPLP